MVELAGRWPLTAERNARPDVNVMDAGAPVAELASSTLTISRRRAIACAIASNVTDIFLATALQSGQVTAVAEKRQ
jgi:hypothetical protein